MTSTASLDTEVREIYEVDDTKALSLDQMDLVDGEIPDINELEELDIGRFVFKDETEWPDLVTAKFAETTMKKLKYVESIFVDWRRSRNSKRGEFLLFIKIFIISWNTLHQGRGGGQVPEKNVEDFDIIELNKWLPFFLNEIRPV